MRDLSDMELVQDYNRQGSQAAFSELVERHINLVYSAALRHVEIAADAEEITQAVFVIFARKAAGLRPETVLEGWLYETTRLTSSSFLRGERRRRLREQEAYMQSNNEETNNISVWNQLAPLLDEAISRLGEKDRDALLLRFFKEKSLGEVAMALNVTETAAQSRVYRALEKLRKFFTKRGVVLTTTIIAGAISANSVQAAPVTLAKSATFMAIAKGAVVSGSTLILVKGALNLMTLAKVKTTAVIGMAIILAAGVTAIAVDESFWQMKLENLQTAPAVVIVRPSQYSDHMAMTDDEGRVIAHNLNFAGLLEVAYAHTPQRMILPSDVPTGEFELMLTLPDHQKEALQKIIKQQFGYLASREIRDTDALLLKVKDPRTLAFHVSNRESKMKFKNAKNSQAWSNYPMSYVAHFLEGAFNKPVIVQPGISENYDITFQWKDEQDKKQALVDELDLAGLELVPSREPIEMLIVEKAQ